MSQAEMIYPAAHAVNLVFECCVVDRTNERL
jgi:hypothetical protein